VSSTPLIEAIHAGDDIRVTALLEAGADIHQRDEHGWTLLHWAAGRGHVAVVKTLLERGADPSLSGRDERTPYLVALAAGHADVARALRAAEDARGRSSRVEREYCRAYHLRDLRAFPEWSESRINWKADDSGDQEPLRPEDVVFIHQDFTVTRSMWRGESVIYDQVTPAWQAFCAGPLGFVVPDDLDLIVPTEAAHLASA
jgi:uncharacterized protein